MSSSNLSMSIVNFYNNQDLLNRIKKNCFNSVKKYDWEKVSVEYISLYKKIIERNILQIIKLNEKLAIITYNYYHQNRAKKRIF